MRCPKCGGYSFDDRGGCSIGMIAVGRDFIIGKYKDGTND